MGKNGIVPTAHTTLEDLLSMGAKITFDSGRSLKGDPKDRYIKIANDYGGLGRWDMDTGDGVSCAIADLVRDAAQDGLGLHGEMSPPEDGDVA